MPTCDEALELISARIDGALTQEESRVLEEHLAQCPACRALLADLTALHEALPALEAQPPAGLADAVMDRVRAAPPITLSTTKKRRHWHAWAALAAALVLVVVGGQAVRLWSPFGGAADGAASGSTQLCVSDEIAAETAEAGIAGEDSGEIAAAAQPQVRSGPADDAAVSGDFPEESAPTAPSPAPEADTASAPAAVSTQAPDAGAAAADTPKGGTAQGYSADSAAPSESQAQNDSAWDSGSASPESAPYAVLFSPEADTASGLTAEDAQSALEAWLDLDGQSPDEALPQITLLGYTQDGSAYRFAVAVAGEDTSAVYAVPVDGGDIYLLEADAS